MFFRYTPQSIELEHKLKPFIPDFIPAVGDIDAFVKVCSKGYSFKNIYDIFRCYRENSSPELILKSVTDNTVLSSFVLFKPISDTVLRSVNIHITVCETKFYE